MKHLTVLFILIFCTYLGFAQQINTDRPTGAFSANSLAQGQFQGEGALTYSTNGYFGRLNTLGLSNITLRYGLVDEKLELRLTTNYRFNIESSNSQIQTPRIGAKFTIIPESTGLIPALGVIGNVSLDKFAGNRKFLTDLGFTATHKLPNHFFLTYNAVYQNVLPSKYRIFNYSANLMYESSRETSYFIDFFGSDPTYTITQENYLGGGFLHRITPTLQVDAMLYFGTNKTDEDFIVKFGISKLFIE